MGPGGVCGELGLGVRLQESGTTGIQTHSLTDIACDPF